MAAKRPAPKTAKAKKPATRPAARKAEKRPAERPRALVAASPRKSVPVSSATKKAPNSRPVAAAETPAAKPKAAEASKAVEAPVEKAVEAPVETPQEAAEEAIAVATSSSRLNEPPVSSLTSAADPDDTEGVEPGSLLAGPRNVKPYIPKRGEQYMSKEQLEHFRKILLDWKRDLMEEVDRTVSHMKDEAANFPDPNDRATQEEEFSLELRTRDRERKLIRKIDEALKRTEDGTYGYCLETGEEIGVKRLEARPVATLSIEAQERRERRERQYGDRDDRYR
ncbi:MAG: RNA polymerase-binding protein DksA [Steroidobacteraceae bacterium]|nr:RNA polymerase-binding protein DksA [Steroidobacteraceae bacterium]